MYELVQVAENTYFMECPAKVGIVKTGAAEVVLIDSGSDKDAAKKLKKILDEQGWTLKAIFNTHSHADHTGGNQYLQTQTGCKIYAYGVDAAITENPILEPTMLYGGFTMEELRNKFLMAKESDVETLTTEVLPAGLEMLQLPGHSYDMVGFKTADNVIFLADSLISESTLDKYQISFLYDVQASINTLESIKTMQAECFVPSHAAPVKDIVPLAQKNLDKIFEVVAKIRELLVKPQTFEELLAKIFTEYNLNMNIQQRMLVGSTVKSYLSYLKNKEQINYYFENNLMFWKNEND